jgi:hypothetical protein
MSFHVVCKLVSGVAALSFAALSAPLSAAPGEDLGKKACAQEARRLCPAEMRTFSRKKVEACMIAKINQTSPTCHAAMLRIKAEREGAAKP